MSKHSTPEGLWRGPDVVTHVNTNVYEALLAIERYVEMSSREEYYALRVRCPHCGDERHPDEREQTCMSLMPPPEKRKVIREEMIDSLCVASFEEVEDWSRACDFNRAWCCVCGKKSRIHDELLPPRDHQQ